MIDTLRIASHVFIPSADDRLVMLEDVAGPRQEFVDQVGR